MARKIVFTQDDSVHTRFYLNKKDYCLQDLISKREFSTNITRLVPFHFDPSRFNTQEVAAHDSEEFLIEQILDHQGDLRGRSKKGVLFKVRWLGYDSSHDTWTPGEI